jgi:hypothetical protein
MTKSAFRVVTWPVLAFGLPWLASCGASMPGGLPGADKLPGGMGGACPDTASVEAIEKFDFASNFKLDAKASGKVKAGLGAAVEIKGLADSVDADLKTGCGGLAKDLGASGDYKTGEEACKAAIKVMGEVKAKIGAKAALKLDIKAPECKASLDMYADCAGKCDATIKPGSAKVECEPGKMAGECDAKCEGTCDLSASAKCEGSCSGSCDADIKGSCGGKCDGKCDGKTSKGASCAGTCEGKCDAHVDGTCSGKCGGSCKMKAGAKCEGTCTGKCSVDFKAPKCTGEMKPPEMSADCKAKCDAQVQGHAECSPASVGLRVEGAANAEAAATYKAAIEKNLPVVLKVAIGVGERGVKMAGNVSGVVEGVEGSVKGMAGDPLAGGKLAACVAAPFKGAIDAAASLKANVNVSVEVKASASASGSAGGKAGGGG